MIKVTLFSLNGTFFTLYLDSNCRHFTEHTGNTGQTGQTGQTRVPTRPVRDSKSLSRRDKSLKNPERDGTISVRFGTGHGTGRSVRSTSHFYLLDKQNEYYNLYLNITIKYSSRSRIQRLLANRIKSLYPLVLQQRQLVIQN